MLPLILKGAGLIYQKMTDFIGLGHSERSFVARCAELAVQKHRKERGRKP